MDTVNPRGETVQLRKSPESLSERLREFYDQAHFFPHTNRELSLGKGAINSANEAGGFARYLNKVLEHQLKSNSANPQAALELIVKEVSGCMNEANAARSFALEIWDDLDVARSEDHLYDIFGDDWKVQASTHRGLGDLQRRVAMDELLTGEVDDTKIESLLTDKNIEGMLNDLTVREAKRYLDTLTDEELTRAEFWKQQLQSARSHMVVSAMSQRALGILQ